MWPWFAIVSLVAIGVGGYGLKKVIEYAEYEPTGIMGLMYPLGITGGVTLIGVVGLLVSIGVWAF